MRRLRHVVLPVRSWQYVGLLIVSLACLTLGLVSRDREGRHGSLAGPELQHVAPHKVDACPNIGLLTQMDLQGNVTAKCEDPVEDFPKILKDASTMTRTARMKREYRYLTDRNARMRQRSVDSRVLRDAPQDRTFIRETEIVSRRFFDNRNRDIATITRTSRKDRYLTNRNSRTQQRIFDTRVVRNAQRERRSTRDTEIVSRRFMENRNRDISTVARTSRNSHFLESQSRDARLLRNGNRYIEPAIEPLVRRERNPVLYLQSRTERRDTRDASFTRERTFRRELTPISRDHRNHSREKSNHRSRSAVHFERREEANILERQRRAVRVNGNSKNVLTRTYDDRLSRLRNSRYFDNRQRKAETSRRDARAMEQRDAREKENLRLSRSVDRELSQWRDREIVSTSARDVARSRVSYQERRVTLSGERSDERRNRVDSQRWRQTPHTADRHYFLRDDRDEQSRIDLAQRLKRDATRLMNRRTDNQNIDSRSYRETMNRNRQLDGRSRPISRDQREFDIPNRRWSLVKRERESKLGTRALTSVTRNARNRQLEPAESRNRKLSLTTTNYSTNVLKRDVRQNILKDSIRQNRLIPNSMLAARMYLNAETPSYTLNYEILRQTVVIILCALYGSSLYNDKGNIIKNIMLRLNRYVTW